MKFISWNVNGIRAWIKKGGILDYVEKENPDFFCLQETKALKEQVDEFLEKEDTPLFETNGSEPQKIFPQYPHHYWNSAEKKGYSGTAIFSKQKAISESYGLDTLPEEEKDKEGRVITLEFEKFFLVTVYTPNSKHGLLRLPYRYNTWDKAFLAHMQKLEEQKPVIACGDLNVAHNEIDLANPKTNKTRASHPGNPGFSDQERERFGDFMNAGFIDTFRYLHPDTVRYSWWSYRAFARQRNIGWRIDYFLTSGALKDKITAADIHDHQEGSDHCPVVLEMDL